MSHRKISLRILGCGSSGGVPRIGGDWGRCDPSNPKNRRSRCSALIKIGRPDAAEKDTTQILIDTAPDMREQLLAACVTRLDAVLITHDHADQCHGLDDLRALALTHKSMVPIYTDKSCRKSLRARFGYCFQEHFGYPPILHAGPDLEPGRDTYFDGPGGSVHVQILDQNHGAIQSLGFRFGPIAYCNDVKAFPPESFQALEELDFLCIDALRYEPHKSHAHLDLALEWIEQLRPKHAVLTNLHIDMDYASLSAQLPTGVEPAYDGMEIETVLTG